MKPRNFYEKMPEGIEDNYVDELFLKGMAHKNSFPDLHYPVMIKSTVEIVHVLNSVIFQIAMFYKLVNSEVDTKIEHMFFGITIVLSLIGYIVYSYYKIEANQDKIGEQDGIQQKITFTQICKIIFGWDFVKNVQQILFLSMILNLVIPVLGSLTVTYCDATIILDYASKFSIFLDFILFVLLVFVFIHLIYYDFEMMNQKPELSMPQPLVKPK